MIGQSFQVASPCDIAPFTLRLPRRLRFRLAIAGLSDPNSATPGHGSDCCTDCRRRNMLRRALPRL